MFDSSHSRATGMGWRELLTVALFVIITLHNAGCKVIVRETDITTRGKTFQVICTVEDEDLVGWFNKEGRKITTKNIFAKYYIENDGPDKQVLYIANVKVADGGNYTCQGSKNVGHFELFVEFYTVLFPKSLHKNVGDSVVLPCAGIGYPKPIYRWYKNWQSQELGTHSLERYQKLSNGSLYIANLIEEDASNYTCRIIQLEETKRSREERKHIEFSVYGPPRLDPLQSSTVIYSYKGNPRKVQISCRWWGFPIPRMNFTKQRGGGLLKDASRDSRTIHGYVETKDDNDFGNYVCAATNVLGTERHTIQVKEADGPYSPSNVSFSVHCGYVTVTWKEPAFDGGLPIKRYDLEILRHDTILDDASAGSTKRRFTFDGGFIAPNTLYLVRVRAQNEAKAGVWMIGQVTSDYCPPRGKINITNPQTVLNSTSFTLTWTGPSDNGGDENLSYSIEYSKLDQGGNYVHWVTIKNVRDKQHNITGLERGHQYKFRVVGVNRMGQSEPGEKVFEITDVATTKQPQVQVVEQDLVYDIHVNCTSMVIQVDLTLRSTHSLDVESFRLNDPACTADQKTSSHVILRTRLDGCGTTNQHYNMSVTYYNSVKARVVQSKSKMYIVEFPFSCTFIKMRTIGTPSFQPRRRVSVIEEGFGNFSFEMDLYKSSRYQLPFDVSDYPVNVPVTQNLFAQTKLLSSDKNLEALAFTCIATPSIDPTDQLHYSFIENGCSIDSTVKFRAVAGVNQRFQMLPFKFRNVTNPVVYLHCRVMVCHKDDVESRCRKGCIPNTRGARSVDISRRSSIHRVTLGPVKVVNPTKKDFPRGAKKTSIGVLLAAIFGSIVGSVILVAGIVYALRHSIVSQTGLLKVSTECDQLEMQGCT